MKEEEGGEIFENKVCVRLRVCRSPHCFSERMNLWKDEKSAVKCFNSVRQVASPDSCKRSSCRANRGFLLVCGCVCVCLACTLVMNTGSMNNQVCWRCQQVWEGSGVGQRGEERKERAKR